MQGKFLFIQVDDEVHATALTWERSNIFPASEKASLILPL
jgi:hypothetical protein